MTINTVKFSQFVLPNLSNTTNTLVGVSSPAGGINYQAGFPLTWVNATRPSSPANGTLGYNVSLSQYEYWNGAAWVQLSAGGSGTVNPGAQNQVAWYATTGTAISGLLNFANSVLVTNAGTVPSLSTILPASLTIPIPNIIGVTDGSNAAAGSVGEYIFSIIPYASPIVISNGVASNITSISLSAGDWDIFGNALGFDSTDGLTAFGCWTSTTSATLPDRVFISEANAGSTHANWQDFSLPVPTLRYSFSTTTIVYLTCSISTISPGDLKACGAIYARRVR